MASETSRCACTVTSWTTAGTSPSASDVRAMWLNPHVWLCLKRMTGAWCDASSSASSWTRVVRGWNTVTSRFYRAAALGLLISALAAAPSGAQSAVAKGASEWSASAGAARGLTLLQSAGGDRYATAQLAWGRVLTDLRGPRWLRGRFEWSLEVMPTFVEWSSGHARGVGVSPLGWRWNVAPHGAWHPYAEVGGGALWTSAPIPDGTTGSNFTSYAGVGVRRLGAGGHGLIVSYRLHHISNGNRLRTNPGVNAHMITVGWTRVRAR